MVVSSCDVCKCVRRVVDPGRDRLIELASQRMTAWTVYTHTLLPIEYVLTLVSSSLMLLYYFLQNSTYSVYARSVHTV